MTDQRLVLYLGVYADAGRAEADYRDLVALHQSGRVGTYDAAVVAKDETGHVSLAKHEKPTQHAAWTGIGVGAVLGILFPPSIIGSAVVAGTAGGLIGHLWKGMSRADVKELGDVIDEGEAALVVIGETTIDSYVKDAVKHAKKEIAKELDMSTKDLDKELQKAAAELA